MMKNMDFHKVTMMLLLSVISIPAVAQEQDDSSSAQELDEYYPQGTFWIEEWYWGGKPTQYRRTTVEGDTVIGDVSYKRVVCEEFKSGVDELCLDFSDVAWEYKTDYHIREDSGKVYYLPPHKTVEGLEYDYNWKVGKPIYLYYNEWAESNEYYVTDSIPQVELLDGNMYDLLMDEEDPWNFSPMIRSIGRVRSFDPIFLFFGAFVFDGSYQYCVIVNFTRNGENLFNFHEVIADFRPTGIAAPLASPSSSGAIYDLQGRRLKQIPAHGVYIQDGRKHVR